LVGTRSQRFENCDFLKKTSIQFRTGKYLKGPKVDFNHFGKDFGEVFFFPDRWPRIFFFRQKMLDFQIAVLPAGCCS